jgi:alkanesulfonate monooxygenase SsuD/methylene tetrahydromethanopterin reductase-like flavin-dependent oxidoreductase (luciferase family)
MGSVRERIAQLDETLDALRALWRGETVSRAGRHVQLDGAWVRPTPPGGHIPIAVAARRPRMLEVVAAHADVWEVNLPPVPLRVARAAEQLAQACERRGRSEAEISRSMLLFTRMDRDRASALGEFRRLNPWFHSIPDSELGPALVLGEAPRCRARIAELAAELRLDCPVLDLSGLEASAARRLLEALRPDE